MKFFIIILIITSITGFFFYNKLKKTKSTNGLTTEEIKTLENQLQKTLPTEYKSILMNYPDDLIHLGYPYNTVSELSLPNSIERILEINKLENIPENILIIGVNGLGDFYYLILDNQDSKSIYEFPHEAPPMKNNGEIDWRTPLAYDDLEEFKDDLFDRLEEGTNFTTKKVVYFDSNDIIVNINCDMKDEWQKNRGLQTADTYPKSINHSEISNQLKVDNTLFDGYNDNQTIHYTFLVSVNKNGNIKSPDYQGGDNMLIIDEVEKNIKLLKFSPGLRNGENVDSYTIVKYSISKK